MPADSRYRFDSYRVSDRVEVDLGYRLLEGGADNDEVYTFALFHYAVAGVRLRRVAEEHQHRDEDRGHQPSGLSRFTSRIAC